MTSVLDDWPYPPSDERGLRPAPGGGPDVRPQAELVDGILVSTAPQRRFHERLLYGLRTALNAQAPGDVIAVTRMDVMLGARRRTCADVALVDDLAAADDDRSCYWADEVRLVI